MLLGRTYGEIGLVVFILLLVHAAGWLQRAGDVLARLFHSKRP